MYARVAPGVDPARQKAFIVLWSTFNLLSCAGFLVLLTIGVNTMLTWTGHVGNAETPWTLCLISGSLGSALASAQATAACVLVVKAWSHAVMVLRPRSRTLRWLSSSYFLVALPWIVSMPFFLATLSLGVHNPDTIRRTSPMYCSFTGTALTNSILGVSVLFEIIALSLAAWTAALVLRTRWRVKSLQTSTVNAAAAIDRNYYPLIIRTLIFAVLLLVTFGANIGSAFSSFSNPIPDVLTSFVFLVAVFVFGSDPNTIRTLRCTVYESGPPHSSGSPVISLVFAHPTGIDAHTDVIPDASTESCPVLELKNMHVSGDGDLREVLGAFHGKDRMSRSEESVRRS